MHSKHFERVKRHYERGHWKIGAVRNAVKKGWITEEEFALIVGEKYA